MNGLGLWPGPLPCMARAQGLGPRPHAQGPGLGLGTRPRSLGGLRHAAKAWAWEAGAQGSTNQWILYNWAR